LRITVSLGWMRGMALAYGYQPRVHWAPTLFCPVPALPPPRVGGKTRETEKELASHAGGRRKMRQSGFGWLVLVSHYRGGHKGSRRILILVSPNLLTYLAYPGNSRRIHPAPWDNSILESSSLQRDNLWSPLFASLSLCSPPFFPFFPSSRLWGLPFLARRFFPVFSGAALR
jgi:hypothetical protein